jgi:hypothetical protein
MGEHLPCFRDASPGSPLGQAAPYVERLLRIRVMLPKLSQTFSTDDVQVNSFLLSRANVTKLVTFRQGRRQCGPKQSIRLLYFPREV